ncbi:hypothetical protein HPY86_02290 [candidate division WOR-3 bacterium]|nr:hypothetical protein [candidate division WOR-3 bacterium]
MFSLLSLFLALFYEPRYWLAYPALNEVRSITFSPRAVFVGVPNGIYILDRKTLTHQKTITALDGVEGEIRLCAYNPAYNELLIVTDRHLYNFIPLTGRVLTLNPPFQQTRSIGITRQGVYFDTEKGLFQKLRTADFYQPVSTVPEPVIWYGEKDTFSVRNYPFLTPYFIADAQLNPCPFLKAWQNPYDNRLFVFAQNYGILVYNARTGWRENEIRIGPLISNIGRLLPGQDKMFFFSPDHFLTLDSDGNWNLFSSEPQQLFSSGWQPFIRYLYRLNQIENITAILMQNGATTLIGTEHGVYRIGPDEKAAFFLPTNSTVNALAQVNDSIIVATDNGMFLLINDSLTSVSDPFARTDWGVFAITRNNRKTFFGTQGGVLELDSNNTWTHLIPPGFDLSQPVRALAAGDRFLFVGSKDGIDIYDTKHNTWAKIVLPSLSPIKELYADNRYLWLVSREMVARYEYRAQLH